MKLSEFGEKFTSKSGILELMDDLGKAVSGADHVCMLGGGNPGSIEQVNTVWRRCLTELMAQGSRMEDALANYDTPQGKHSFLTALASLLKGQYGWDIGPENIAVTNGSQNAFFILLNLFFRDGCRGSQKKDPFFPMCPEYIGYVVIRLWKRVFSKTVPAAIHDEDGFFFKYHCGTSQK